MTREVASPGVRFIAFGLELAARLVEIINLFSGYLNVLTISFDPSLPVRL